jgi:hypothetical protein
MSVKEHLYLLLLIFKQEKRFGRAWEGNLGSRRIFLSVLESHKKTLGGPLFAHPCCTVNLPLATYTDTRRTEYRTHIHADFSLLTKTL